MKKILLIISLAVTLFSCSKDKSSDPAPANTNNANSITINSPCQFSLTLDGVHYSGIEGVSGYMVLSLHNESSGPPPYAHSYTSFIASQNNLPMFIISKGTIYENTAPPDTADLLNFYSPGNYNYIITGDQGIAIGFKPDSLNELISNDSLLNQSNSSFTITDCKTDYDLPLEEYFIKVKATFNCKLYDMHGTVRTLTNGVAVFKVYPNL
jgi:hypothetical protein